MYFRRTFCRSESSHIKVIYSLFTHFFLLWVSFFISAVSRPRYPAQVSFLSTSSLFCSLCGHIHHNTQFLWSRCFSSFSISVRVFMSSGQFLLRHIFSVFLFLQFMLSFCLFFSPLLNSYHFFFIIVSLSVSLFLVFFFLVVSVLSFHLLSLSLDLFAENAILPKQGLQCQQ